MSTIKRLFSIGGFIVKAFKANQIGSGWTNEGCGRCGEGSTGGYPMYDVTYERKAMSVWTLQLYTGRIIEIVDSLKRSGLL